MLHLLACADDPALFDAVDTSVLFAEPSEDFEQRASMSRPGTARLGIDGEDLPVEAVVTLAAVFDPGDEVGAIVDHRGLRFLVYLDRDALTTVIAERSRVRGRPAGTAVSGGFDLDHDGAWLPAGTVVDVVDLGPTFSRVTRDSGDLVVDGWLPTGELDEVWAPSPALPDPPEPDTWLPSNVTIHDGPGGEAFARTDDVDWEVEPVGWVPAATLERHDGWRRVRVDDGDTVVVGWVAEAATEVRAQGGRFSCGWGCRGWGEGSFGSTAPPTLPADTVLFDGIDGPPVARALADLWPTTRPNPLGGWDVDVYTPWGETVLWVDVSPRPGP